MGSKNFAKKVGKLKIKNLEREREGGERKYRKSSSSDDRKEEHEEEYYEKN